MLYYVVEEVDLGDMLMDAVDDLWPQLAAKRISIETIGEDDRLIVRGERSLLTRALTNVIGNAIKFSDEDTQIRCTLARVSSEDGVDFASCAIADDGPGLPPDQQQIIFERRSEEHTSELQSLMRISYAVFCLKKKTRKKPYKNYNYQYSIPFL